MLSESSAPWKEGLESDGRRPRDGGDNGNGRQREPLSSLGRAARSLGVFKVLKANSKFGLFSWNTENHKKIAAR